MIHEEDNKFPVGHVPVRQSHMYRASVMQWNPFVGCLFGCLYCLLSFQLQLKRWAKNHCEGCYRFIPHEHPERLEQSVRFGPWAARECREIPGQFLGPTPGRSCDDDQKVVIVKRGSRQKPRLLPVKAI